MLIESIFLMYIVIPFTVAIGCAGVLLGILFFTTGSFEQATSRAFAVFGFMFGMLMIALLISIPVFCGWNYILINILSVKPITHLIAYEWSILYWTGWRIGDWILEKF